MFNGQSRNPQFDQSYVIVHFFTFSQWTDNRAQQTKKSLQPFTRLFFFSLHKNGNKTHIHFLLNSLYIDYTSRCPFNPIFIGADKCNNDFYRSVSLFTKFSSYKLIHLRNLCLFFEKNSTCFNFHCITTYI